MEKEERLDKLARKPLAVVIINKLSQIGTHHWDSILLKLTTDELLKLDKSVDEFIDSHDWLNIEK